MDPFSYLSVLISIILGLGITQLLTGLGRVLQTRGRTRVYWPAITWVGLLLLVHVQTWWTMYGLRGVGEWTIGKFVVVLLQPAILYLMSALALPDFGTDAPVDLRAGYFANGRWFFGLAVLLLVESVVKDLVVDRALPDALNLGAHVVFFALWGTAAVTRREWYHRLAAPATLVLFAAYTAVLFARLR